MMTLANASSLADELAEVSQEHEAATRQTAKRVMGVLDRVGLAELVRWHIRLELLQEQPRALLPAPEEATRPRRKKAVRMKRAKKSRATSKRTTGSLRDTDEIRAAKRELLTEALELAAAGKPTWPAFVAIASKAVKLPGRPPRKYTPEAVRQWFKRLGAHPQAKGRRVAWKAASSESAKGETSAKDGKKDNPQPLPRTAWKDPSRNRRMDCPALQRCTLIAKRKQWKVFGCHKCSGAGGKHA